MGTQRMTLRWSTAWQDNPDGEPNRYLDWDRVTGGIEPAWRGDGRDLLFLNGLGKDAIQRLFDALIAPSRLRLFDRDVGSRPRSTVPTAEDHQKELLIHLLVSILTQFKEPSLRLPPVPRASLTLCPQTDSPDCYYDHVVRSLALPQVLMPDILADASSSVSGSAGQAPTAFPKELGVPEDTVIMGIVDVGIPLGHRSTRFADGTTRILAAWQQTAPRDPAWTDPANKAHQFYLPFGRELLAPQIDAALKAHSKDEDLGAALDEDAFNRATGLENYRDPFGQRDLGLRASHGAHVLATAAGMEGDTALAERARIIAVNLPDRALVGHSAQFLEFFAVHAIMRVVMLADALWDKQHAGTPDQTRKGFPIVINLSFGKQASSRDSLDPITDLIDTLNRDRERDGRPPVVLCLPAGNENLERGNIRTSLGAGAVATFDWRILPADQSANFVELWANAHDLAVDAPSPLEIQVVPPGGPESPWTGGKDGQVLDLWETQTDPRTGDAPPNADLVARLYSDRHGPRSAHEKAFDEFASDSFVEKLKTLAGENASDPGSTTDQVTESDETQSPRRRRLHYLIAVKQTLLFEDTKLAPAGLWRIRLRNATDRPMRLDISVQTDQTEEPRSAINQRSHFEHTDYVRYDETGRVVDSYTYPLDNSDPDVTDVSNILRRHGSINAVGHSPHAILAAGHRVTDGRMLAYSATGHFRLEAGLERPGEGRKPDAPLPTRDPGRVEGAAPLASLPIRDGAAHFGRLSAGSRDGAVVAMEGTSFAAAQLSRRVLELFLETPSAKSETVLTALRLAARGEDRQQDFPGRAMPLKAGSGRMAPHGSAGGRRF